MFRDVPLPPLDLEHMFDFGRPVPPARAEALAAELNDLGATWLRDPRRCFPDQELVFYCDACQGMGATGWNYDDLCHACDGRGNEMRRSSVALPTAGQDVTHLLASRDRVETIEALAREAVRRLGPDHRLSKVERVQWGRVNLGKPLGTIPVVIGSAIWSGVRTPADWDWDHMKGPAFAAAPWFSQARKLDELTRQVLCFDVGMAWAQAAAGHPESPFEPLLRMWELGVMMEELDAQKMVLERVGHRYVRSWRSGVPMG